MANSPDSFMERLVRDAGIVEGMRVLDYGCGPGDVTRLLARMVGAQGQVLGVDRDAAMLRLAQENADAEGLTWARFDQADLTGPLTGLGTFDAVVGRRVLMYLPDPTATLQELAQLLVPGGLVVCQESDSTLLQSRQGGFALHDQVLQWIWRTVESEGANLHMGFALPAVLDGAGFSVEHIRAEPVIQGQGTQHPLHHIIRIMLPRILSQGIATAEEIGLDTLEARLRAERPSNSVVVSDMAFGAWARRR